MTAPHYEDDAVTLWHGDCLDVLAEMPDASIDAVVCDPPYGLEFMGKEWDSFPVRKRGQGGTGSASEWAGGVEFSTAPAATRAFQQWCERWAAQCLRVLKPGGHLLAFGGTRTWHRLAAAVEDAGFEVRDSIAWLYGSGFPKSLDVSKAIDKRGGADIGWFGPWLREHRRARGISSNALARNFPSRTGGETGCVRNWELGLNLPTPEQFNTLCRVLNLPFAEIAEAEREVTGQHAAGLATGASGVGGAGVGKERRDNAASRAAQQWQGWGTALKPAFEPIVVARKPLVGTVAANVLAHGTGALNIDGCRVEGIADRPGTTPPSSGERNSMAGGLPRQDYTPNAAGRWPANVLLDGSQAEALDEQSGTLTSGKMQPTHTTAGVNGRGTYGKDAAGGFTTMETYGDSGGASRFFPTFRYQAKAPTRERVKVDGIAHPTVKPLELMRWLVRLVTPPGGVVLEPFAGSGTTVEAALLEGFRCIAIEREADYLPLIEARIARNQHTPEGLPAVAEALALFDFEEPA